MKNSHDLLPECYVDTNIVNTLMCLENVFVNANHCHGCNKVGDDMKNRLSNQFALGIIDNDKRQHSYNKNFDVIDHTEHIELLKHRTEKQYLLRISPAMDGFIIDVAERNNINLQDYELPDNLEDFTVITKDEKAKDSKNLKKLFRNMINDREIILLKDLLVYIYCNKYNCNFNDLINIFTKYRTP